MNWYKQIYPAIMLTIILTVITGIIYPLAVTGLAQILFKDKAQGSLIVKDGKVIGSKLIGQPFTGAGYFHSRPSAVGAGYDATSSGGTNLGPTSKKLIGNIQAASDGYKAESNGRPIPIDLVTTSASGFDPHITPAGAEFQIARVAKERNISEDQMRRLVQQYSEGRQFGLLGEPRVNVLELNMVLDATYPLAKK